MKQATLKKKEQGFIVLKQKIMLLKLKKQKKDYCGKFMYPQGKLHHFYSYIVNDELQST